MQAATITKRTMGEPINCGSVKPPLDPEIVNFHAFFFTPGPKVLFITRITQLHRNLLQKHLK